MGVQFVSITSYNEWGEGTQIEPAVPRDTHQGCQYLSYEPESSFLYMEITRNGSHRLGQLAAAAADKETCVASRGGTDANTRGMKDDGNAAGLGGGDDGLSDRGGGGDDGLSDEICDVNVSRAPDE